MTDPVLHLLWPEFPVFNLLISVHDSAMNSPVEYHLRFPVQDVFWYCSHPPAFFATVGHGVTGVSPVPGNGTLYQSRRQDGPWLPVDLEDRNSKLAPFYKYDVPTGEPNPTGMFDIPLISRLDAVCINLDVMRTSRYSSDSSCTSSFDPAAASHRSRTVDESNLVQGFLADTSNEDLATRVINCRDGGCTVSWALTAVEQSHIIPKQNATTVSVLTSTPSPMLIVCVCSRVVGRTLLSSGDSETLRISILAILSRFITRLISSSMTRRAVFSFQWVHLLPE